MYTMLYGNTVHIKCTLRLFFTHLESNKCNPSFKQIQHIVHTPLNRNEPQNYQQRESNEDLPGTQLSTSRSVDREDQERGHSESNVDRTQSTGTDYTTLQYQIRLLPEQEEVPVEYRTCSCNNADIVHSIVLQTFVIV